MIYIEKFNPKFVLIFFSPKDPTFCWLPMPRTGSRCRIGAAAGQSCDGGRVELMPGREEFVDGQWVGRW